MAKAGAPDGKALEQYERLVATQPDIERKGATMPYTSCNGHMFSFLAKDGKVSIRLPADELETFLKKYKTTRSVQHGTTMQEYAVVPSALLAKTKELSQYFGISLAYVAALKPKPTTRKKKSASAKAKNSSTKKSTKASGKPAAKQVKKKPVKKTPNKKVVKKASKKKMAKKKPAAKRSGGAAVNRKAVKRKTVKRKAATPKTAKSAKASGGKTAKKTKRSAR